MTTELTELIAALIDAIKQALSLYLYSDAIFYAERLFEVQSDYQHLHLLAECYYKSGDVGSACRLLQYHYPYLTNITQNLSLPYESQELHHRTAPHMPQSSHSSSSESRSSSQLSLEKKKQYKEQEQTQEQGTVFPLLLTKTKASGTSSNSKSKNIAHEKTNGKAKRSTQTLSAPPLSTLPRRSSAEPPSQQTISFNRNTSSVGCTNRIRTFHSQNDVEHVKSATWGTSSISTTTIASQRKSTQHLVNTNNNNIINKFKENKKYNNKGENNKSIKNCQKIIDWRSRWKCEYLLGVTCCQSQRYVDAHKIFTELLRFAHDELKRLKVRGMEHSVVDDDSINNNNGNTINKNKHCVNTKNKSCSSKNNVTSKRESEIHDESNKNRKSIGKENEESLSPTFIKRVLQEINNEDNGAVFTTYQQENADNVFYFSRHIASIRYWLGVIEQRRRMKCATEHFSSAIQIDPLHISAFDQYTQLAIHPHESCLQWMLPTTAQSEMVVKDKEIKMTMAMSRNHIMSKLPDTLRDNVDLDNKTRIKNKTIVVNSDMKTNDNSGAIHQKGNESEVSKNGQEEKQVISTNILSSSERVVCASHCKNRPSMRSEQVHRALESNEEKVKRLKTKSNSITTTTTTTTKEAKAAHLLSSFSGALSPVVQRKRGKSEEIVSSESNANISSNKRNINDDDDDDDDDDNSKSIRTEEIVNVESSVRARNNELNENKTTCIDDNNDNNNEENEVNLPSKGRAVNVEKCSVKERDDDDINNDYDDNDVQECTPCTVHTRKRERSSSQTNILLRFLEPFSTVMYYMNTFRCKQAEAYISSFPAICQQNNLPLSRGLLNEHLLGEEEENCEWCGSKQYGQLFDDVYANKVTHLNTLWEQNKCQLHDTKTNKEETVRSAGRNSSCTFYNTQSTNSEWLQRSPWLISHLAMCLFHTGRLQECVAVFRDLLHIFPWRLNNTSLIYYSTALWQLKDEIALSSLAQQLMQEIPLSEVTLCVVANLYSLKQDNKAAVAMLSRATQINPFCAYAYALKGYELLALHDFTASLEAFYSAISADAHLYTAYAGLGEVHLKEDKLELARRFFRQALQLNKLPAILNRYAATFHCKGATQSELQEALRLYEMSMQLHPYNLSAQHQRTEVLVRLGRVDEAEDALKYLTTQCPQEAMLYLTLARLAHHKGNVAEAIKYYHTALQLDPRREAYIRSCLEKLASNQQNEAK